MSETGLEEKVENMNVEEKEPKAQAGAKGGGKAKGEKKKKEDPCGFPLEVSSFMRVSLRACHSLTNLVHRKIRIPSFSGVILC